MTDYFTKYAGVAGLGRANLHTVFDAEHGAPKLLEVLAQRVPQIRDVLSSLRESLPVVPHCRVGPLGRFHRLPNHYRSVSFILPPDPGQRETSLPGVIVFKGTEPLVADFPTYYDWMLETPFRSSSLSLGLHFPLDMKLPPAAMWIRECKSEQAISTEVQARYFDRYQRLARLPFPLFVFKMTEQQEQHYESVVRRRLSQDAMQKISNKLEDGLGVEVYYYPELPVRVLDLYVGNLREIFKDVLIPAHLAVIVGRWTQLFSELLCLGYMPYAPWHLGMGGCVDPGNACVDGGFNDLLTLVPFDAIPDNAFRACLGASTKMLSESVAGLIASHIDPQGLAGKDPDAVALAMVHITDRLWHHVREEERNGAVVDERLLRCCVVPEVADMVVLLSDSHKVRHRGGQYLEAVSLEQSS